MLERTPFAPGERYTMMWGCCAGTHASSTWQNNGNDYYAAPGTVCVAPIDGEVVRAGVPGIGQGERVGIQGATHSVYMAHMTALRVKQGDRVKAGALVGVLWDWGGSSMPPHLHFSLARGSYGGGVFIDPWQQVQALGIHITGRVYEAPKPATPAPTVRPPAVITQHFVEELPARLGGNGPDVFGPWRDTPDNRLRRDQTVVKMKEAGRLVVPMNDTLGDLYIYEYRQNTYGRPFRYGSWANAEGAAKAEKVLVGDGRLTKPRRFVNRGNSLYPWI